jgi:NADPH2 dehydrogenase
MVRRAGEGLERGEEHPPTSKAISLIRPCYTLQITDVVHARGSFIYSQLWALGRTADPNTLAEDGFDFVSASGIQVAPGCPVPRPLTKDEIQEYIQLFARAAENAIRAGFDGVELHGSVFS